MLLGRPIDHKAPPRMLTIPGNALMPSLLHRPYIYAPLYKYIDLTGYTAKQHKSVSVLLYQGSSRQFE